MKTFEIEVKKSMVSQMRNLTSIAPRKTLKTPYMPSPKHRVSVPVLKLEVLFKGR